MQNRIHIFIREFITPAIVPKFLTIPDHAEKFFFRFNIWSD